MRLKITIAIALVTTLAVSLPAVGAPSPTQIAKKALRTAKRSDKRAKKALKRHPLRGRRGVTGPVGPAGAPGAAGPNGSAGQTGATGPPGTARAYAQVSSASITIVAARTKGFTGVSRPSPGVYCLAIDPALGIDPESVAAVASPEYGGSTIHGGSVEVHAAATGSCPSGEFAVRAFDSTDTATNSVSFNLIVP
jgi:hypothetical protein